MIHNRKGNFVTFFIIAAIAGVLIASFALPAVFRGDRAQTQTLNLVRDNEPNLEAVTLGRTATTTNGTLIADSVVITGLTTPENYSVNYTTGVVTFDNSTINGTYASSYQYYDTTYLTNSTERALFGVIALAFIIGLVFFLLNGLGVI